MEILNKIAELVEQGKADAQSKHPRKLQGQPGVAETVKDAIDQKIEPMKILEEGLSLGMRNLGKKFNDGQAFVPEILLAMKAMQAGVAVLRPLLGEEGAQTKGAVIIGTVYGDIHDIGKNLVRMLLESAGWNVVDLGVNVTPQQFVEAAKDKKPAAVGLSALLTTTMGKMQETVKALRDAGLQTPVIIGGAPVTDKYAQEIGAMYGKSPQAAIEILESLPIAS